MGFVIALPGLWSQYVLGHGWKERSTAAKKFLFITTLVGLVIALIGLSLMGLG